MYPDEESLDKHIKTHSEPSSLDSAAVTTVESFLRTQNGKINTNFSKCDKWPNTDGTFEFVPNPDISRCPEQNFFVQIKGTESGEVKNGVFKYSLKSLAFPAFIAAGKSFDPGILFVVLNPRSKGNERVFWKHMSSDFVYSIDYKNKESTTIEFTLKDEIKYTDESVEEFCDKLNEIIEKHSFSTKLENISYEKDDVLRIINICNDEITKKLEEGSILNSSRDDLSKSILTKLDGFCAAALLLNDLDKPGKKTNLAIAWERAVLNIKTKYLADFYRGIKYRGFRIPQDGQSERLMLKYYGFLWQIKESLKKNHNIDILQNLDKFPLNANKEDDEYNTLVANAIEKAQKPGKKPYSERYYIQKKTPFYINGKRYFEITLQLANVYATKFNRITVYSTEDISTDYSIKITYQETEIVLWNVPVKIKLVTAWKVSIAPKCLNLLGKVLKIPIRITSKHGEYEKLMNFLTKSGINLLHFIDLKDDKFVKTIDEIYKDTNTSDFRHVLEKLKKYFTKHVNTEGKKVVRYVLIDLREDTLKSILGEYGQNKLNYEHVNIKRECYPFEKNPYLSNLVGKKTNESNFLNIIDAAGDEKLKICKPCLAIKDLIKKTGEIYFDVKNPEMIKEIERYNNQLGSWDIKNGYKINIENGKIYIDSYEKTTLNILKKLIEISKNENLDRIEKNKRFVSNICDDIDDIKIRAIKNAFVDSELLLIYGAAGTGKTTLVNYICELMKDKNKLFLSKTHTAIQNLKRRIKDTTKAKFNTIDSCTKKKTPLDFDIIFIDECTTIDNRTMNDFLSLLNHDTLLVLAGDIYQIESIDFGNWFFYAKDLIKTQGANVELLNTWRTKEKNLIGLWDEVRKRKPLITEKLVIDGPFSRDINENVLKKDSQDEVILCLNYDGKYGLNNMNTYFQNANTSEPVKWGEWNYKIKDPVLFCDTKRFTYLYNN